MSHTPTYRVETHAKGVYMTPAAWPTKHAGRPSDKTLAVYVADFEASCAHGVNRHLGETVILSAKIVRQSTGETVATYRA